VTLSILFWILMILWLLFGAAPYMRAGEKSWSVIGQGLVVWLAVAVLGWAVFGPIVKG
jgi:hypothetical protein